MNSERTKKVTRGVIYTVDEAFSRAGFGRFQWKILFLTGAMWSSEAVEIMLLTFLMPILNDSWNLDGAWTAMIGIFVFLGSLCGSFVFSMLSDKHGRRIVVICSSVIVALTGTLTAFVTDIQILLIFRFISGFGLSGIVPTLVLFQEMVPPNSRGTSVWIEMSFWTVGSIISVSLAWAILPNVDVSYGWRLYIGLSTILPWSVVIGASYLPESVRYYSTVGDFDSAERLISKILKENGKSPMKGRLIQNKIVTGRGNIKDLFVTRYWKTSVVVLFNFITSFCCYYSIVFVSERLFNSSSLYVCEFVTTLAELPALLVALYIDIVGRKMVLILSWTLNTIGFLIIAASWYYMSSAWYTESFYVITVFVVRLSVYVNSMTIYLYTTEYYPTAIRTTALGLGYAFSRLGAAGGTFLSEGISIVIGNIILSSVSAISCLSIFLIPEDTVGRALSNDVDRTSCKTTSADHYLPIIDSQPIKKYGSL